VNFSLAFVILIGVVVRLWGIDFGLPQTSSRHDESLIIGQAMRYGLGDFNPHAYYYYSLYSYILFGFYVLYFGVGLFMGLFTNVASFVGEFSLDPTIFYLISRIFSAFLGTASVYVIYKLAREIFEERVAIVSALFLSLTYLHVRESHFGKADVMATLLLLCSVFYILKIIKTKDYKNYLLAGLFAGLSASIKYFGVLLFVPLLVVHAYGFKDLRKVRVSEFVDVFFISFVLAMAAGFVIGIPYSILDIKAYYFDVLRVLREISQSWHGIIIENELREL
jgi:dolichyl-phosphate-mannose--protein O-mannosyl transferase